MGALSLGQDIGLALSGGDIDRQGAHLEGLDVGSKIAARKASTVNALAQARLRTDEANARVGLADQMELGGMNALAAVLRAGGKMEDFTGAQGDMQMQGFRDTIADVGNPWETRNSAAMAVEGKTQDPFQYGPGGELFNNIMSTEDPTLSQTGQSQVGLDASAARENDAGADFDIARALSHPEEALAKINASNALTRSRDALAGLNDKKTTNPELFKSSTTINTGTSNLGDAILEDIGDTTIPDNLDPAQATGVTGFGKSISNTLFDIVDADLPWPEADIAGNALNDLHKRTMIVGQQSVPGRPSNYLMQAFATFGVEPNDPFRSDQRSMTRLAQTSRYLGGEIDRLRRILNAGRLTPSQIIKYEDPLRSLAMLQQDFDIVISRFNASQAQKTGAGFNSMDVGATTTINGVTVKRTN